MKIIENIKKKYSSEFFKYSAVLLSSNALSQLIAIIVYPLITRIYNPAVFGEFTLILSITSILSLIATGKYELAILLPKSEKKAVALFQLCFCLNIIFFIISLSVVLLFKRDIAVFLNQEKLISLFLFIPFIVFLSGCWQAMNYFLIRQKKYYNVSIYNVTQSAFNSGLKLLLGIKGLIQSGLMWATLFGQFIATLISVVSGRSHFKQALKMDKAQIINIAKGYSNFPKFELPHELMNSLAGNLPILLLALYFEMKEVGLFALALTLGFRPVNLFTNSVYQVLYRKMAEKIQNKEKLGKYLFSFYKTCCVAFLPFFILFLFISEWVFGLFFGIEWIESGFYIKLMLPWLFMIILTASSSFIPDLFFRQKTAMMIEVAYVSLRLLALIAGIYFNDFRLAIALYCAVSAIMLGVKLIWYFYLVKKYELTVAN